MNLIEQVTEFFKLQLPVVDFRANWSKAVNDPETKPYKDKMYGNKIKGSINGKHYVMYNAMRGLPLERGFIKGNETISLHIASIERDIRWAENRKLMDTSVFPFDVPMWEFKEKWDEALRLYSS